MTVQKSMMAHWNIQVLVINEEGSPNVDKTVTGVDVAGDRNILLREIPDSETRYGDYNVEYAERVQNSHEKFYWEEENPDSFTFYSERPITIFPEKQTYAIPDTV